MKKRKLIERKRALREAYFNELKKMGVINGVVETPPGAKTVKIKAVKKANKKVEE